MSSPNDYAAVLGSALSDGHAGEPLAHRTILFLLANSMLLGLVLALVTFFAGKLLDRKVGESRAGSIKRDRAALFGTSNLLFLCVGLTGTMILVNSNMVRAFAIAAAIALVRFRIKLDGKSANASLLFGILAGVACGLNEIAFGWTLMGTYLVLMGILFAALRVVGQPQARKKHNVLEIEPARPSLRALPSTTTLETKKPKVA